MIGIAVSFYGCPAVFADKIFRGSGKFFHFLPSLFSKMLAIMRSNVLD